jgi:hypothetical protein
MRAFLRISIIGILTAPAGVAAHHSVGANFDRSELIEVEGEITEVLWQNPHIQFSITAVGPDGVEQNWDIETNSGSIVRRIGLSPDLVSVGTRVRVAGNPGRVTDNSMWLQNMLLPNSEEILFAANVAPRWSDQTIGADIRSAVAADPGGELGIFRVWTSATSPPQFWGSDHPLTPTARATRAAFDPIADDPTADCVPKGMPYIMEQPYPMAFVDEGDVITMQMEEYDTVRRFLMSPDADAQASVPGILGRSIGRWEGDVLVVETTDIDYPWFNNTGIPQSRHARIEERFELNEDGSRLEYEMLYTDPLAFTEFITLTKAWEWRPGEEVQPYNCVN